MLFDHRKWRPPKTVMVTNKKDNIGAVPLITRLELRRLEIIYRALYPKQSASDSRQHLVVPCHRIAAAVDNAAHARPNIMHTPAVLKDLLVVVPVPCQCKRKQRPHTPTH